MLPRTKHGRAALALSSTWFLLSLLAMAMAAIALRMLTRDESLWLDELHTSWTVHGRLSDVAQRAAQGNQAPLYYWLAWFATRLFGESESVLRSLSWLAGGMFVLTLGWLTRRWTGSFSLGLLAALLATCDPNCLYFGREARPYAWVSLLALWHVMLFRSRISRRVAVQSGITGARAAWILLSWALFYTHYTAILLLPGELLYIVCTPNWRRFSSRLQQRRLAADVACIVAGCLFALPQLVTLFQHRGNWSHFVKPQPWTSIWTQFPTDLYVVPPILIALLLAAVSLVLKRPASMRRIRHFLPLLLCLYLVPVATAWAMTQWTGTPLLFRRYIWVAVVPLLIHPSLWGTMQVSHWGRRAFTVVMIAWAANYWLSLPRDVWLRHSKEDWRAAVAVIDSDPQRHKLPVFLRAGLVEDRQLDNKSSLSFREYCSFALQGIYSSSKPRGEIIALNSDPSVGLLPAEQALLIEHQQAWLIFRGALATARLMLETWQDDLARAGVRLESERVTQFPGVVVILLSVDRIDRVGRNEQTLLLPELRSQINRLGHRQSVSILNVRLRCSGRSATSLPAYTRIVRVRACAIRYPSIIVASR